MQDSQQESEEEEEKPNAKELRKILENLLSTSFEQEKVMLALKKNEHQRPAYIASVQQQRTIKDNMKTIADSLFSLSKRVPQIESTVNTEEIDKINFNMGKQILVSWAQEKPHPKSLLHNDLIKQPCPHAE